MELKEFFTAVGGNYENVLTRLPSESFAKKFLFKFLQDESYSLRKDSLSNKDFSTAFRAAHTLKGVCLNLGFDRLLQSASAITEVLRGGNNPPSYLFEAVTKDYNEVIENLKLLFAVN